MSTAFLHAQNPQPRGGFHPWFVKEHRTGRWKLPRLKCLWWHLSAPRSAVFARDFGPSAKAGSVDVSRRFPRCASSRFAPATPSPSRSSQAGGAPRTLPAKATSQRTMPTHPPDPAPLCAAQARPARRSGREAKGPVRYPAASPVSPEGDHFPQARCMEVCVSSPHPAPTPPRCNALQCIRGGMGDCRHGLSGRGK
jgi:hypothetical protein